MKNIVKKFSDGINLVKILFYAKVFKKRLPVLVAFHVTKYCDLKCKHCYADLDSIKITKEPTTKEIIEIIDELYSCGTRWIRVLGGEPLIRNDIDFIVKYIKRKGILCELGTNGMLVKKKIDLIKKMNLDILCISIDGDRASNDKIRGEGTYDKIVEAIKVARENKIRVRIHATVTKQNLDCLYHIANLAVKYNAVFNCNTYLLPKEKEIEEFKLTPEEIKTFYIAAKELRKKGYPVMNSELAMDYIINWPLQDRDIIYRKDLINLENTKFVRCTGGRLSFFLDADGFLYPCPRKWKYGLNIHKVGVKKAVEYCSNLDCVACQSIGCTEADLILSLNPKAVWNAFLVYFDRLLKSEK